MNSISERNAKRGYPREKSTYRADRRNHSILNRDRKSSKSSGFANWYGVETKSSSLEQPPLALKTSKRGETHYEQVW